MQKGAISDTGNWNIARPFAEKKFHEPLSDCDDLEIIAYFGCSSILEELTDSPPHIDHQKAVAIERLIERLIQITYNAKFAMKKKGTAEKLQEIKKELLQIRKYLPILFIKVQNMNKQTKRIKDIKVYERVLRRISELKSNLNVPLNDNHLIFIDREEFDPRGFKDKLKSRIRDKG